MTAGPPGTQALIDLYAQHPLREDTILARVARQRGSLDGLGELDLAHDSVTEITDQNHAGGIAAVVRLALRAGVQPASRVLDVGAGLGGSARGLAHLFGCRVDALELSPLRAADSASLSRRVQLDHLVSSICGDALSAPLPSRHFDVVWGQGAWMHIADTASLFARTAESLVPGGRVAFEEVCLLRAPRSEAEAAQVTLLARLWGGRFLTRDAWREGMEAAGLQLTAEDDLTPDFVQHVRRLTEIARSQGASLYPAHETAAFDEAASLGANGVIGYTRFVARK